MDTDRAILYMRRVYESGEAALSIALFLRFTVNHYREISAYRDGWATGYVRGKFSR